MGLGITGVETQGLVEAGQCLVVAAQLGESRGLSHPPARRTRVEGERPVVAVDGFGVPARLEELARLVAPRERIAGVDVQGRVVRGDRLVASPQAGECYASGLPGLGAAGVQAEGLVDVAKGLREPAGASVGDGAVGEGTGVPGPQLDVAAEGQERFVEPAELGERVAAVAVQDGFVGTQAEGLVIAGEGLGVSSQAGEADSPLTEVVGRGPFGQGDRHRFAGACEQEASEVGAEDGEARVALGTLLLEAARDHGHERGVEWRRRGRLVEPTKLGEEAPPRVGSGSDLGKEGQGAPRRHLIEHDAEAVDVAALVAARRVHELLGGHVGGRAEHCARDGSPHFQGPGRRAAPRPRAPRPPRCRSR